MISAISVFAVFVLSFSAVLRFSERSERFPKVTPIGRTGPDARVRMVAFGDINLGRAVGQKILEGDVDFPFRKFSTNDDSADIVFANLESQLSNQKGETQHPKYNLIFTGPPQGAGSLSRAKIVYVSTANNHAFDYGRDGLFETLENLDAVNVAHVGTARFKELLYEPFLLDRKGIRFAIFAVTDVMNFEKGWQEFVAVADTGKLFPAIRDAKKNADAVIVSFHGGEEYADKPTDRVKKFAELCIDEGVILVVGHHPHVPYGIQKRGRGYIVHSLGNFVFYQPQEYWTQLGYGVEVDFIKNDSVTSISGIRCIPVESGLQPALLSEAGKLERLRERIQALSNIPITWKRRGAAD